MCGRLFNGLKNHLCVKNFLTKSAITAITAFPNFMITLMDIKVTSMLLFLHISHAHFLNAYQTLIKTNSTGIFHYNLQLSHFSTKDKALPFIASLVKRAVDLGFQDRFSEIREGPLVQELPIKGGI